MNSTILYGKKDCYNLKFQNKVQKSKCECKNIKTWQFIYIKQYVPLNVLISVGLSSVSWERVSRSAPEPYHAHGNNKNLFLN